MLAELSIRNFAIIEELTISIQKGLTVLSGETGAGKSIIIDAIGLLVGGRGSAEYVRFGKEKSEIEGLFHLDHETHPIITKTNELGVETFDGSIVLRRDILKNGKSVCRVNGKLVTLGILREIGQTLLDIHGQHEHQELMDQEHHINLLDQFAEETLSADLAEYKNLYKKHQSYISQIKNLTENEQQLAHRLDLLQFQFKEISSAELEPGEDETLTDEKIKITNYQKIYQAINTSYHALHGDQRGIDWLGLAMTHLESISSIDEEYKKLYEMISSTFYQLEDISYTLRDQLDGLEHDTDRLNVIESRLGEISQLKRKYGHSVEEILYYAAEIEDEIDEIKNRDSHIHNVRKNLQHSAADLLIEAQTLSDIRKKSALQLEKSILQELKELYMDKADFKIQFSHRVGSENDPEINGERIRLHSNGFDQIEFYISPNPGEPLKPLTKIVSGGELSRIMLALKSIFSKHQGVTSIIFDEVDTGVSGRVAQAIAEKIHRVSVNSQVLCISHLPQVAAMADHHLFIRKDTLHDQTKTTIKRLSENEKIKEVARMISGVEITDLTKEHAKELLNLATKLKQVTT